MDAIDRRLLDLLRANARLSYAELARQVGLSAPAVHERVGNDAVQLYVGRYARPRLGGTARRLGGARDTVALVHVTGPIHLGPSGRQRLAPRR